MIAPALQTEGKQLQVAQGVGMGARGSAAAAPEPGNGIHPQPAVEAPGLEAAEAPEYESAVWQ
jgi:hypothetical protein